MKKTNTAFLSFADPDRDLAKTLSQMFSLANEYAYFAPDELGKAGTPEWRKEILAQIKKSHSFVPIYTRHSVRRPWVLYESGVADSVGLKRFPARVSSVSPSDIDYLPGGPVLCFDLSTEDGVVDLITNACVQKGGERSEALVRVRKACRQNEAVVNRIMVLARTRWVFIAGNVPRGTSRLDSEVKWYTTQADYEMRLKDLCELLAEFLLRSGFSVAACPQVRPVGMHVTRKVLSCLDSQEYQDPVGFKIAGIYPIDREARELAFSEKAKRKWLDHILAFRGTYLADQEWIVLIGGSEGTREEYEAATSYGVKTYAVPCFGGTAMRVFDEGGSLKIGPCATCTRRDGQCKDEAVKEMVACLKSASLALPAAKAR